MAVKKKTTASKKETAKRGRGAKPKFDYTGYAFLSAIEDMARQGYSDCSIAYGLADRFNGTCLDPEYFSTLKNEKGEDGKPTERSMKISKALARGRTDVNAAVRATYLQLALGQRKVKNITTQKIRAKDGTITDDEVVSTTEVEIAPSLQALSIWLFNHDREWRENLLSHKREELSIAEAQAEVTPTEVNVQITYNQKSDIQLQEKLKKPSQ